MVTSSKWLQTPFPRSQQVISYGLYPYFNKWSLTCLCNTAFFATGRVKNILRSIYYGIDISLFHQPHSWITLIGLPNLYLRVWLSGCVRLPWLVCVLAYEPFNSSTEYCIICQICLLAVQQKDIWCHQVASRWICTVSYNEENGICSSPSKELPL